MSDSNPPSLSGAANASAATTIESVSVPLVGIDSEQRITFANLQASTLLDIEGLVLPAALTKAISEETLSHNIQLALLHQAEAPETPALFGWNGHRVFASPASNGHLIFFLPEAITPGTEKGGETEHLRRYLSTALAGIGSWTWNLKTRQLRGDSILSSVLELENQTELSIIDMLQNVHQDDLPRLREAIQDAIDSADEEEVEIDTEFRFFLPHGEQIWLAMRGGAIRNGAGKATALSGVYFDVTERKKVEQSVLQAKIALDEVNRAKDSFLAKVSHEIRTPLTTILGYSELLSQRLQSHEDRSYVNQILESCHFLQNLVDDLLDLSRVIAGKISVDRQPMDITKLAHDLLSNGNMRAADKGLGFSLNLDPGVPQQTLSDPFRVRQILMNLVGNAVKFTQSGEISVGISPVERNGSEYIAFSVKDTGPGIEQERIKELFEPFAQAPGSDSSRSGGLGLGLAIGQRLAEVLNGMIEVKSSIGQGSTFSLLLPHEPADEDAAFVAADEQTLGLDQLNSTLSLTGRVLVADDVDAILALLHEYLSNAGLQVDTAHDGLEALAAMQQHSYRLVLMDLQMPNLDGRQTLARMRANGNTTPVIALTASAMKGDRERCLSWGFNDFLSKPFRIPELLSVVKRQLEQKSKDRVHSAQTTELSSLLLVEDNEALATITAKRLKSLGYIVEVAHTGAAAIDRANALKPSAVVMDLTLPDMDGISLCSILRSEPSLSEIPIIAYTGNEDPTDHTHALEAGFTEVLVKPASLQQFRASLVKVKDSIRLI